MIYIIHLSAANGLNSSFIDSPIDPDEHRVTPLLPDHPKARIDLACLQEALASFVLLIQADLVVLPRVQDDLSPYRRFQLGRCFPVLV